MRFLVFLLFTALLGTSCATSYLDANFGSDTIGGSPNAALPGDPVGDTLLFHPDIADRLEVRTGGFSAKGLHYRHSPVSNTNLTQHRDWVGFESRTITLDKPIAYNVWLHPAPNQGDLLIDFSDGDSPMISRVTFRPGPDQTGSIFLSNENSFSGAHPEGDHLGTYQKDEGVFLSLTFRLSNNQYDLTLLHNGNTIERKNVPATLRSEANAQTRAAPKVSFKLTGSTYASPAGQVLIDRVTIQPSS